VNRWHYDKTRITPVTCADPLAEYNKKSKRIGPNISINGSTNGGDDHTPFMDSDDDEKLLDKIHQHFLGLKKALKNGSDITFAADEFLNSKTSAGAAKQQNIINLEQQPDGNSSDEEEENPVSKKRKRRGATSKKKTKSISTADINPAAAPKKPRASRAKNADAIVPLSSVPIIGMQNLFLYY